MNKFTLINRNFLLLFVGRMVSDIGNFFYQFAIGWYILTLTSSASQAGLYMAFGGIVYLLFTPLAGVLVDRLDRLKIIYITDYIRGITVIAAGLLIVLKPVIPLPWGTLAFSSTTTQLWVLYITAFIFSINGALFAPAVTTIVPYLVEDKDLQKANSLNSGQHALVTIIGAIFAGLLYGALGIGYIFLINGIAYILSAISEMFIQVKSKVEGKSKLTLTLAINEFKEGFEFILHKEGMFTFVLIVLFVNFFGSPIFAVAQPYFYNQIVQAEAYFYSLVGLGFSIGSIAMSIYLSNKENDGKVYPFLLKGLLGFTAGIGLFGILVLLFILNLLAFWPMYVLSLFVSFFVGLMITYVNTPIGVALHRYVPKEKMGRVNSMISLLAQGIVPLSTVLAGVIIEYLSLPSFYLVACLGMAFIFVIGRSSKTLKAF